MKLALFPSITAILLACGFYPAAWAQSQAAPADSAGNAEWGAPSKSSYTPIVRRSRWANGFMNERKEDSLRQVFAAERGMRHQFDRFYSDSNGNWSVSSTSFGDLEGQSRLIWVATPSFDKASFKNNSPYWRDRKGVYYARLAYFQQEVFAVRQADPVTFRRLPLQNLAVDKKRVFQSGYVVPALLPATLRVYTPNGEQYDFPDCGSGSSYLLSGKVGYRPNGQLLTKAELLNFRPPAPYKLAYPLPTQQLIKAKLK